MSKHTLAFLARRAALALTLAVGCATASAAPIRVQIDTSSFGAASGYLDLQWSATSGVPLAIATVTNMQGFDPSAYVESWGLTAVRGGYQFRNDTANDLFHAVAFGGMLSFDLEFAGAADPLSSYLSRFVVSAFDTAYTPLGNYSPVTLALAEFTWRPPLDTIGLGTVSIKLYDSQAVSLIDRDSNPVPEPSVFLLTVLGVIAMAAAARHRPRLSKKAS